MRALWIGLLFCGCCRASSEQASEAPSSEPSSKLSSEANDSPATEKPRAEGQKPVRLPGVMKPAPWLAEATRVVAYGGRENAIIVAAGTGWLRWFDSSGAALGERLGAGGAQVLEVADLDQDGKQEVIVARGRARGAVDAQASLEILRLGKSVEVETIPLPVTSRAQVVAAVPVPGAHNAIWVASFVSKFEVEVNRYERSTAGEWSVAESRGRHRVVGDMTVLPDGTPVIARMYGDTADTDGGVYALSSADTVFPIPSTRGARAVLAMPGPEMGVVMADGWHKEYGRRAQGLLSFATQKDKVWARKSGVHVAKNYGYSQLRVGDVHRQPDLELIASGNGNAVVVLPTRPDLLFELSGAVAVDAYPIDLSGDERMEVVIAGPKPAIWSAR